jgi:hypothetical protein
MVQCHKEDEMLTTDGECLTSSAIHRWCDKKHPSSSVEPALTAHGTVACECKDLLSAYWPVDGECYQVFTRGPCKDGFLLVYSGSNSTRLMRTNGLECVLNPCNMTEDAVPWRVGFSSGCYHPGRQDVPQTLTELNRLGRASNVAVEIVVIYT